MTGHGDARHQSHGRIASIEIRTVNSRYFKLMVRGSESYASLEAEIESYVRQRIRRGSVSVTVRIEREKTADDFRINTQVLENYRSQLSHFGEALVPLGDLLTLPGVIDEPSAANVDLASDWPAVQPALAAAVDSLDNMRAAEGATTHADLVANCESIDEQLKQIELRSPIVVQQFQQRLLDRLNKLLAEHQVTATTADVIREIGLFSERCDISEEIVRLGSHIRQFDAILDSPESAGRKLEFLIQEMLRETNTIGSKANDSQIAMHVVEIKTCIERMREQIQNVE